MLHVFFSFLHHNPTYATYTASSLAMVYNSHVLTALSRFSDRNLHRQVVQYRFFKGLDKYSDISYQVRLRVSYVVVVIADQHP